MQACPEGELALADIIERMSNANAWLWGIVGEMFDILYSPTGYSAYSGVYRAQIRAVWGLEHMSLSVWSCILIHR